MSPEQSFGRRVRQRRRELDLTQEELARRVGCAAITLRKIEADDARPSVQIAERLALALAIPLDDRAEFVRQARAARPEPALPEAPTPAPALEEIGHDDLSGRAIRGYALAEKIGAGGMGAVYRAIQPNVEREVAIKIILPQFANHPDFIRRFEAEAQLVARLEHPHIVPLYDYWREPRVAYLVMRLLRGGSVEALLGHGPLPLETIATLLEHICSALHTAHRMGVIHRDLKPANVLLDEDHNAYLTDFGVAKNLGNPNLEAQTQADMLIGSPQYMSPEQIRSLSIRPQTDIYCLGVMLYEMLTGSLPFTGPTPFELIQQHVTAPMPPLAARREGLPAALDNVIARAAAKDAEQRYQDVVSLLDDFRLALSGLRLGPVSVPSMEAEASSEAINPYKGLRAFAEADVEDFFGRETLVQQLLARLGEGGDLSRFLAVVGPSGSGKSSVVRAGLMPALRRGGLVGSENWFIVDCLPGPHPFEELEATLLRVAVHWPAEAQQVLPLLTQLKENDRGLVRAVRRILPADESVELVLVLDQFEEVFTLVQDEAERALFLSNLVTAILDDHSRVRVVITLRADFIDRPLQYVDFGELVQRRSEFVLPLTPDELERAILGPARRVGLQLEAGLDSTIVRDVADQPGALPLLQYALTELFDKRHGRRLTQAAYAKIGGVLGALGRRAEDLFQSLNAAEQATARQLFLRLVTLGEGVEDTRRRVLRAELQSLAVGGPPIADDPPTGARVGRYSREAVLDAFGRHRLLTFDRDPITRGPTVEVAHEALLREWPRLRDWLNESRADVRLQRQLAAAAADWERAAGDPSFLLAGARLEQFEGWAASTTVALTAAERAFLDASLAERERGLAAEWDRQRRELEAARQLAETERARAETERQRAEEQVQYTARVRLRNRAVAAAGVVALVLAVLAGVFGLQASWNAAQADRNFGVAQANAATAQAASDRAEGERRLAVSRELALAANSNLSVDPERSILLALQALSQAQTVEAESALHSAVQASRVQLTLNHGIGVASVTYSPDGARLATASEDETARVWDAVTGQELLSFSQPAGFLVIRFSPDGTRLATADNVGTASVWDAATGEKLLTLSGHADFVQSLAWSRDGARLATGSGDTTAKVWDAATGQELLTLSGHTDIVDVLGFSPDGSRLVAGSWDSTAKIWDLATGEELLTLAGHNLPIGALWSPNGGRIVTSGGDAWSIVWDAATGRELLRLPDSSVYGALAFSPDGTRFVKAHDDGQVVVWDVATGEQVLAFPSHLSSVRDAAFHPDGIHFATASADGTAKVFDTSPQGSREWLTVSGLSGRFQKVAISATPGGQLLATSGPDNTAVIWDGATGDALLTLTGHTDIVLGLAFSPNGSRLATASADLTARVWDTATGQALLTLSQAGHGEGVIAGTNRGLVAAAFSPDGLRLATAGADGTAIVWDAVTGQPLLTLSNRGIGITDLAFSPDGERLATTSYDIVLPDVETDNYAYTRMWDTATGEELFSIAHAVNGPNGMAFSPDGTRLATVGHGLNVWDAATGQALLSLPGSTGGVTGAGVAFSPDGLTLATGAGDGTARLWDAASGQARLTLTGHAGAVTGVAFSADGTRLATASRDGTARVYLLRLEDLIALAKSRITRTLTPAECQQYLHMEVCPAGP
jgi:WD40 repeat protein/transcriptional regulator with XRE-family HTH domain